MIDALSHLNWLAIVLAALVYYLLGAAWFTPLFGKAWDRSIGYDRAKGQRFGISYYLVPLVSALLVSIALATILSALAVGSLAEALFAGIVIGVGVAVPISINNGLTPHTPHPFLFGTVTGTYHCAGIMVAAAIIGAFATP